MPRFNVIKSNPAILVFVCLLAVLTACGGEKDAPTEDAASVDNANPESLTQVAVQKQAIGAYEEAIALLDRALKLDPQYAPAHFRSGLVYAEWDKRKEAVTSFKKALELDPANVDARVALAEVYTKQNRMELAIVQYTKAAKTRPDNAEIHFKIALENWYLQQLPESAASYERVIEIDPGHMQAHLNLASVYEKMEEWDKAMQEVTTALKLGKERGDTQAISIADGKLKRIKGRSHFTDSDMKRKTQPPFE